MKHTYLWFLQIISGGLILLLGGTHLVLMHLDNILGFFGIEIGEPSSWDSMWSAFSRFWLAFYIIFLVIVLYHGLNGLRGVILELAPSPRMERAITYLLGLFGVAAVALGIYAPLDLFLS